ncbi:MAG: hypothetical protein ACLQG5_06865 [Methanobacterium sp.]|jgi:hypothetical protein
MVEEVDDDLEELTGYRIKEIDERDIDIVIELILNHINRPVQELLKSKNLPFSGTTDKLKVKLKKSIIDGVVSSVELSSLLDRIEDYGDQHIFLFQVPNDALNNLRDYSFVYDIIKEKGYDNVYNNYDSLKLPENREIILIKHNDYWLKIRWGIKKDDLGSPEENIIEEDDGKKYLIKKYLITEVRETTLFQISLPTGEAELLIKRGKGLDYEKEKDFYIQKICEIFGWNSLDAIELLPVINEIGSSGDVRARNIGLRTPRESTIDIGSPSPQEGIDDDPDAVSTITNLGTSVGTKGHFYWLPENSDILQRELYSRFYSNRFSVYGERSEEEINYVIERVRHHLQG